MFDPSSACEPEQAQPARKDHRRRRGGLLILFMVIQLVIVPVFERNTRLRGRCSPKRNPCRNAALEIRIHSLSARTKQSEARFTRRDKGFTLFSFLDQLAGQARVKER